MKSVVSLGYRLSGWLMVLSFAGLAAVCVIVYGAMAYSFRVQQDDMLRQKATQVHHLLPEATTNVNPALKQHKLDDFLVGHANLWLTLRDREGRIYYEKRPKNLPIENLRTLRFDVAPSDLSDMKLAATLTLDTRDEQRLLQRVGLILIAAAGCGVGVIGAGGFFLVRAGLRPVRHLADQTAKLAADTLHHRLDGSTQPAELVPLVMQFNELLTRLERAYEQLENFNADVAHELCTPLTTLIASTELAIRKPRGQEELREVLGTNLEDLQRMATIVQDMLFLSRADCGALARRVPVESLAAIAAAVAEYHEASLDEADLHLRILGDGAGEFDVGLLHRAISNLVSNATRYADSGTIVEIHIAALGDETRLTVVNRGAAIEPTQLPHVFDRFYRGDSARSGSDQNHGLGLAIVSAIARMHGGTVFAASERGLTSVGLTLKHQAQQPVETAKPHNSAAQRRGSKPSHTTTD